MVKLSMEGEEHTQLAVTVPLFLKKLWKMVNDQEAENIIGWNSNGDGFVIYDQLQFITKLLPQYFKHNNMASFIRQLNFYDFHKIAGIDKDEIHFSHNCFLKDLPETLVFIKRKCTAMKSKLAGNAKEEELTELLNGVKELKTKHSLVDNELRLLKQENASLWSEINNLRVKHSKQTKIINKIIHFLITYMHSQNSLSKRNGVTTRKNSQKNIKTGPTILEIDYHNHDPHAPKPAKKNPYTVLEPSDIAYDIESQQLLNMQPPVDSYMDEILDATNQDQVASSKKLVRANTMSRSNIDMLGNYKVNTLGNPKPNISGGRKVGAGSNVLGNQAPNIFSNPKAKEIVNSLSTMVTPKSEVLDDSIPAALEAPKDTILGNPKFMVNSKQSSPTTTKSLESTNENFGMYSDNESMSLPFKNAKKYNKILENPKENLGLYLNNIQMELNSLQDMLGNLSSAELTNFCNLMDTIEPEIDQGDLDVGTTGTEVADLAQEISNEPLGLGNNEEYVSKDLLSDEFVIMPMESNLSEANNENNNFESTQFTPDNPIPENLVDEYFNADF